MDCFGNLQWWKNGCPFRKNTLLPTIIDADGSSSWYKHGLIHRTEIKNNKYLPAYTNPAGVQAWFMYGFYKHPCSLNANNNYPQPCLIDAQNNKYYCNSGSVYTHV